MSIKYQGVDVIIECYRSSMDEVSIRRTNNQCWPSGCCVRVLKRNISCLTDGDNGNEIAAELRNLKMLGKIQ